MVSSDYLKEMCVAPKESKAYYRPFICNGDLSKVDIFFVGINPATPIFPEQMGLDEYVNLLLNYDMFMEHYKTSRLSQDKDEISRTRIGMNSFFNWLSQYTDSSIVETDVISYPTSKLKGLKKEPRFIIERGKDIFYSLVTTFEPSLIILHGKKTVENVYEIFVKERLIGDHDINLVQSIEEMEKLSPLVKFNYTNGKPAVIMASRHFMYYGNKGDSFESFRQNVQEILKSGLLQITEHSRN